MTELLTILIQAQDVGKDAGVSVPVQWTLLGLLITGIGGLFVRHEKVRDRNEDRLVEQNRELVDELRTLQKTVTDDVVPALINNNASMRDLTAEVREWLRQLSNQRGDRS